VPRPMPPPTHGRRAKVGQQQSPGQSGRLKLNAEGHPGAASASNAWGSRAGTPVQHQAKISVLADHERETQADSNRRPAQEKQPRKGILYSQQPRDRSDGLSRATSEGPAACAQAAFTPARQIHLRPERKKHVQKARSDSPCNQPLAHPSPATFEHRLHSGLVYASLLISNPKGETARARGRGVTGASKRGEAAALILRWAGRSGIIHSIDSAAIRSQCAGRAWKCVHLEVLLIWG